jgi:hypothetical protein
MANDTSTFYFQYAFNKSQLVYFWFTKQGVDRPGWCQFIADYDQAGQIASWIDNLDEIPPPLNLNLLNGSTLSFSCTATAVTISGTDSAIRNSMSETFSIPDFSLMLIAVFYSIQALLQNQGDIVQDPASHPLLKNSKAGS